MEIIKEKLYERGSFSDTYYSFLEQHGFAREYSKKSALDYTGYKEKTRRGSRGADRKQSYEDSGREQNGRRTSDKTRNDGLASFKASSVDGVFFDGENTPLDEVEGGKTKSQNSLSKADAEHRRYGRDVSMSQYALEEELHPIREDVAPAPEKSVKAEKAVSRELTLNTLWRTTSHRLHRERRSQQIDALKTV